MCSTSCTATSPGANNSHILRQVRDSDLERYEKFWAVNQYVAGGYDDPAAFGRLDAAICELEKGPAANRLFYLALPPSVFQPVTTNIKAKCMGKK